MPWRYAFFATAAAVFIVHSLMFDFVCDDAFISFVYARNLAEHGQLVFNLGMDPVEGYTNFLWTVLLAGAMKLGVPPEIGSRVFGTAFAVATLALAVRLVARVRRQRSAWDLVPASLLALSSGFAAWSSGGLETQMFTFLGLLGLDFYLGDKLVASGLIFALCAMTRPEGSLIFAVALAHRIGVALLAERRFRPRSSEVLWVAAFLCLYAPYFVWRYKTYGYLLPNTAYVKAGGTPPPGYAATLRAQGLFYVWQWAWQSRALFAAPLVAVGVLGHRRFGTLALGLTAVYLTYTVRVGGDFMGLHRFVMPLFVTTALLAGLGLAQLAAWMPRASAVLAVGLVSAFGVSQAFLTRASLRPTADRGIDRPGYLKQYAEDRARVGKVLAPLLGPDDFSFVGGAGVQPYYARMRALDVFGLVSEQIAHDVPPSRARPGHQKWAPPAMVLALAPTFIFYLYALHADPGRHAWNSPGEVAFFLARGYEPCTLHIPGGRPGADYYSFLKARNRDFPCLDVAR